MSTGAGSPARGFFACACFHTDNLFLRRYGLHVSYRDEPQLRRDYGLLLSLISGFRLLNLKNDSLRKRYDGLKYDVKKIEEVVYDLSIRGLNKEAASDAGGEK